MSNSSGGSNSRIAAMGLTPGMVVQELGWDEDVDDALRFDMMDAVDEEFVDEAVEAVDAVLLWWRDDDGDVGDGLVDALTDLSETGSVWLFTPKVGRDGYVDPADVAEAAVSSGLSLTNSVNVSPDWLGQKLVRPRQARR